MDESIVKLFVNGLPHVPKDLILKVMNTKELVEVSNRSEAFAAGLADFNIARAGMKLRFVEDLNEVWMFVRKEVNYHRYTFHTPSNGRFYLENNSTLRMRKIGELEMRGTEVFDDSTEFVCGNTETPCIKVATHLRRLFPSTYMMLLEVDLQRVTNIEALCTAIRGMTCYHVVIMTRAWDSVPKIQRILTALGSVEYLDLQLPDQIPFLYRAPIVGSILTIGYAGWVNNKLLSRWTFKKATFCTSNYENGDFVEFLQMWRSGAFPGVEEISWNNTKTIQLALIAHLVEGIPSEKDFFVIRESDGAKGHFTVRYRNFDFEVNKNLQPAGPAAQPVAGPAPQPAAGPVPQPAAGPAPQPAAGPAPPPIE